MGKVIDYPKASFKASNQLADAVDSLGGNTSAEMCAERMGLKVGGGFNNIVSSAQKFRLVSYKSGYISTTQAYKDIKLAYTDSEKNDLLIESFLSPPVFSKLYDRFKGKELPVGMLEKMLIKEYQVDENVASRIKKYFLDGAKSTGLLDAQNFVKTTSSNNSGRLEEPLVDSESKDDASHSVIESPNSDFLSLDEFVFQITGPGINSKVAIREEEDFLILEAMIRKVRKRFANEN